MVKGLKKRPDLWAGVQPWTSRSHWAEGSPSRRSGKHYGEARSLSGRSHGVLIFLDYCFCWKSFPPKSKQYLPQFKFCALLCLVKLFFYFFLVFWFYSEIDKFQFSCEMNLWTPTSSFSFSSLPFLQASPHLNLILSSSKASKSNPAKSLDIIKLRLDIIGIYILYM